MDEIATLIDYVKTGSIEDPIKAPRTTNTWPVDYGQVRRWRKRKLKLFAEQPDELKRAWLWYKHRPVEFINHWCDTHDPRNIGKTDENGTPLPVVLPLVMFKRQDELCQFVMQCMEEEANGLIEKSRDMGATWTCISLSTHQWLFWENNVIGWGSATADKLDKLSDPDTIFEKFRLQVMGLPECFKPKGLSRDRHLLLNRLINPSNRSIITGEIGDKIGRGGRTKIYFIDESAHLEHPGLVEAGLSENTRVRIDMSSVSGLGTVFHRARRGGLEWNPGQKMTKKRTNVFIMDWSHHPAKTRDWYKERAEFFANKGMSHVFAQEIDRDYAAAVEGTVIPRKWLESCVDAHRRLKLTGVDEGGNFVGLDVADGGVDSNAAVGRKGWLVNSADQWADRDTGVTTRRAVALCSLKLPCELLYDSVGVGSGVKAETNRMEEDGLLPRGIKITPWNGGQKVVNGSGRIIANDASSPTNKDYYFNLKAQGWGTLRLRVYITHMAVTEGRTVNADDIISFDSQSISDTMLAKLLEELSQATQTPNTKGKMVVDKSPDGMASPNLGDACVICCLPLPDYSFMGLEHIAMPLAVSAGDFKMVCTQCGSRNMVQLQHNLYQCSDCSFLARNDMIGGFEGVHTYGGRR
jgi:hypothetical protein